MESPVSQTLEKGGWRRVPLSSPSSRCRSSDGPSCWPRSLQSFIDKRQRFPRLISKPPLASALDRAESSLIGAVTPGADLGYSRLKSLWRQTEAEFSFVRIDVD